MKKQCAPDGLFKGIKHESEVLPPINPEGYDSPDKAAKTDLKDAAKGSKDVVKDATVLKDSAKDAVEDAAKTDAKDAAKDKGASSTEGRRRLLAADDYKKKELQCMGIHQVGSGAALRGGGGLGMLVAGSCILYGSVGVCIGLPVQWWLQGGGSRR